MKTRLLLALALFFSSLGLCAQTAQITGTVTDASHASISHATITAENTATHLRQEISANAEGFYILPALPPGRYDISVAAPGFETKILQGVALEVAGKLSLDVTLSAGSVSQTVTVDGSGLTVNTVDAAVSTVVDQQFVSNIPLNGRTLQSLITGVPGILSVPVQTVGGAALGGIGFSGEFSVNGARSESNYFTVDGVSANTGQTSTTQIGYGSGYPGSVAQLTALGTTHSLASLDSLQEFRGITSTYAAEYGRSAGGQFALLTRSGTNQLHGTVFEYFRNAVFDANAYFNKFYPNNTFDRPKENQNDFGGTLGGPIFRDRTFFFGSYEGLRLRVPKAATLMLVPTLDARGEGPNTAADPGLWPFLRAFPKPSAFQSLTTHTAGLAEFYASYSTPSTINASSIRVDHTWNDRNRIFGRWSYTPSETTPRYGNDLAIETPNRIVVKTITGGLDTTITSHQVNSLRANYTWNDNISTNRSTNFGGATPLSMSSVTGLSEASQINFYLLQETPNPLIILKNQNSRQTQINITDAYTIAVGRHNLKFGLDWRRLHNRMSLPDFWEITQFRTSTTMFSGRPEVGQVRRFYGKMEPVYNNWSVYAQDEWRTTPHLNLSYGVRWEINPAPVDATGNNPYTVTGTDPNTATLAPKNASLYKTVFTNFAPRAGVAYTVHDADGHQTVVRAGWGLYYEMGNANASNGYLGVGIGAIGAFNNSPYPFTQAQLDSITLTVAPPYAATIFAFDPNLKTPRTQQYSAAIEQQFGRNQTLTISYVGAKGTKGLSSFQYYPSRAGNTNFSASWPLVLTTNAGSSNYNSLQAKFQKTLSHNLQALLSYTWAHSIDNATSNNTLYSLVRGNSDYDVRNNFQATFTYTLPGHYNHRAVSTLLADWAVDGRLSARSALPVDILQASSFDPATGQQLYNRPDRKVSEPLYLYGSQYPGGRAINRAAFSATTAEGNFGRNVARAFNAVQTDLTLHKMFALYDRLNLQFRADAFNIFNKANMGAVSNTWTATSTASPTFGQATNTLNDQLGGLSGIYQQGGPRSLQLALKLQF